MQRVLGLSVVETLVFEFGYDPIVTEDIASELNEGVANTVFFSVVVSSIPAGCRFELSFEFTNSTLIASTRNASRNRDQGTHSVWIGDAPLECQITAIRIPDNRGQFVSAQMVEE